MTGEQNSFPSGHSVWLDTIDRAIIESGQLERLIKAGVSGVASHPDAVAKIVRYRDDYNQLLHELDLEDETPEQLMEAIILYDVETAADYLHSIFDRTEHLDGYVSFDIDPALASKAKDLVAEGLRLAIKMNRANGMLQVPATDEGVHAMESLIGEGVNVNVTLVFSPDRYQAVVEAYIRGMETFLETLDIWPTTPVSVASVPVARLDQAIDEELSEIDGTEAKNLKGHAGLAVARVIYDQYLATFKGERWTKLAEDTVHTVHIQRPLWAESSAPTYAGTINSLPPVAAERMLARQRPGDVSPSLREAQEQLEALDKVGVDLLELEKRLQQETISDRKRAYSYLLADVVDKRDLLQKIA